MTEPDPDQRIETRAIRSGRAHNDTALAPVLWASSTFVAETVEEAHKFATDVTAPKFYGRHANPTTHDFERAIADLEGAEAAVEAARARTEGGLEVRSLQEYHASGIRARGA